MTSKEVQETLDWEFNSYLDHQQDMGLVTKRVFRQMPIKDQKAFYLQWKKMHFASIKMHNLIYKYRKWQKSDI